MTNVAEINAQPRNHWYSDARMEQMKTAVRQAGRTNTTTRPR